jgi:quercetin dioxygenase-like cupin family protein
MSAVQQLLADGRLRIEQLMELEVHEGQGLNWLRVQLAPGVVEPPHVHPGVEGILGISGRGHVQLDRKDRVPLAPGTFVRVEQGTVKALSNDGPEPLVAVAVLVLDRHQPPLSVAE